MKGLLTSLITVLTSPGYKPSHYLPPLISGRLTIDQLRTDYLEAFRHSTVRKASNVFGKREECSITPNIPSAA